ncbi:MAG: hypothetical protein ACREPE_02735 [Lysobacter sp.]
MRLLRLLAGCVCILIGFVLIVVLGVGAFDPTGTTSGTPVLVAMLPSVSVGIAIVAVGVWLITTRKSK